MSPATQVGTVVCHLDDLDPCLGVCAQVGGRQVALFRLPDGSVHALDNFDPLGGANVLSRGLIGDAGGRPYVASPLYKHRYDLASGVCLDGEAQVAVHPVLIADGRVVVG